MKNKKVKFNNLQNLILTVFLLTFSFLIFPFDVSAGVIRKPPNNLGLVLYYPMNEGNGARIDDMSGNGIVGKLIGTTLPGWVNGKLGNALSFGAAFSTRVTFSGPTLTNTHTVSMWIYITSNCPSYGNLFSQGAILGLWCYNQGPGNKVTFYTGSDHLSNTYISLNQWHHIAVTSNAGAITFYLDGNPDGVWSGGVGYTPNTMGSDPSAEYFPGRIDDLRVYNRALSASEILYIYKSGSVKIGLSNSSPGTLANGLTGYWTFDGKDMVSNVADVSGNGNNAVLVNYTSTTTSVGKVGQALNFNGTSNYINTNAPVSNFITASDGTISVWLRPTAPATTVANEAAIRNSGTAISTSGLLDFGIHQAKITSLGGQDKIWLYDFDSTNSLIGIDYSINEWIHVTWVKSGGVLYAYKNGILIGSVTGGNTSLINNLYIGNNWCCNAGTSHWKGDIDEVRTYNRALSTSEINQLYRLSAQTVGKTSTPTGTLQTGLVGHWTFDGGDTNWNTNTVTDKSGNGNTGTLVNMSTSTSPVAGKIGQALNFTAANSSSVGLGTSAGIQPSGNFSVSLWYKGSSGATESFVSSGPTFGNSWDIENSGASFITSSTNASKSYTLPNDNEWHHLVVVLNRTPSPDTVEAYIDGVSQGTATGTLNDTGVNGTGGANIGRGTWLTGGYRQGPMDDVRIYNRVLSASEVKQLYNLGR